MPPVPLVTVVVCTRNRLTKLTRCIDALLAVRAGRDWELIIVDNGSADGTAAYLATLDGKRFDRIRIRTLLEPKPGVSAAKNKGWRAAQGSIIAFTDDDCYVASDYIDAVVQAFADDARIGVLGGRILLFNEADQRITISESTQRCEFHPRSFIAAGAIKGANMAFRRDVLECIDGFDERLGPGTRFPSEDIDAVAAALWSGTIGAYDPRPVVHHDHGRRTIAEARSLMKLYDAGRGAYFAKYILNKASSKTYFAAWINSTKRECRRIFRERGKYDLFPKHAARELYNGLWFTLRYIWNE